MEAKRTRVEAELFDPKFQLRLSNFKKQLAYGLGFEGLGFRVWGQKESDKAIAALSDEKTLGQHVSKARAVHLGVVLFFADQVPLWIKAGSEREDPTQGRPSAPSEIPDLHSAGVDEALFADFEKSSASQAALRQDLRALHDKFVLVFPGQAE